MKKILSLILMVLPILTIGQTITENFVETITYKQSGTVNTYPNRYFPLTATQILANGGNAEGELSIYENQFKVVINATWDPNTNWLNQGSMQTIDLLPIMTSLPLGPLLTSSLQPTGYFAEMKNNQLLITSPYFLSDINSRNMTATIPGGSTFTNYTDYFNISCDCPLDTEVTGGGTLTINRNATGGTLNLSITASWPGIYNLKVGNVTPLLYSIPNTELGFITNNGNNTIYRARIVSNTLQIYTNETIPPRPSECNTTFIINNGEINKETTYLDGLGRPKQHQKVAQSPNGKDIITHLEYDKYGSEPRKYLSYESLVPLRSNYVPHITAKSQFRDYYHTNFKDSIAYSQQLLQKSNSRRILESAAPGTDWKLGSGNEIKSILESNGLNDKVIKYRVSYTTDKLTPLLTNDGFYTINKLYKETIRDENWKPGQPNPLDNSITEFKDNTGKLILKRNYNLNKWHDTYYVYDDYGNLSFVLPPLFNSYPIEQQVWLDQYKAPLSFNLFNSSQSFEVESNFSISSNYLNIYLESYDLPAVTLNTTGVVFDLDFSPPLPDISLGDIEVTKADGTYCPNCYSAYIQNGDLHIQANGTPVAIKDIFASLEVNLANATSMNPVDIQMEITDKAYQYIYDERNRLITKKLPGKQWEYIVYDKLDRPILVQDGNLKLQNKWLFSKYDALGRIVYSGIWTPSITYTRDVLQNTVDTQVSPVWFETKQTTSANFGSPATGIYYTRNTFPKTSAEIEILSVNYYDNYTFDINTLVSESSYSVTPTVNVRSLPTGSKNKILGTTNWTTTVTYYNEKAQVIYIATLNNYLGTTDKVKNKLDFTGKIVESTTTHTKGANTVTFVDKFTYDYADRLLTHKQKINNQDEQLIAKNSYNAVGTLIKKQVGNTEASPLQSIDFDYNIRGWLKNINNISRQSNDLFALNLGYNDPNPLYGTTSFGKPQYNGNISEITWKTDNIVSQLKSYHYTYDALQRLRGANYSENSVINNKYNENITSYDRNGNIYNLSRTTENGTYGSGIDNLDYTYKGNQLLAVKDTYGTTMLGGQGFADGINSGNDFLYDDNGNMKLDHNKNISDITYNFMNLPTKIVFYSADVGTTNPTVILYKYDATGQKIEKTVLSYTRSRQGLVNTTTTTQYGNNCIYENGQLQMFFTPEGYVSNIANTYKYVYQYKDHLGNIRVSYADANNDGVITGKTSEAFYDGFENGSGWESVGVLHAGAVTYDTSRKHSGNTSGRIDKPTPGEIFVHCNTYLDIPGTSPTEYIFSGWVYSNGPTSDIYLFEYKANESDYFTAVEYVSTFETNKWVYLEKKVTVPAGIVKLSIRLDNNGGGSVWFDDISIRKVNPNHEIIEESNYYPFGLKHSNPALVVDYQNAGNYSGQKYKYNGKEWQDELGLNMYDYGARNYDPAIGRWMNIDPLAEKSRRFSPYVYALNNPVFFIDPDGMQASPIYDINGDLLGTDNKGLKGEAIVMPKENFKQGMSHDEALYYNIGKQGLSSDSAYTKLTENYRGLKDRPDYDGKLTLSEANDWYRNGDGKPLFVDLSKVDLSGISASSFEEIGDIRGVQTLYNGTEDGLVYGQMVLKYSGGFAVTAIPDTYDFEYHGKRSKAVTPWGRTKQNSQRALRNFFTLGGRMFADLSPFNLHNTKFQINFYGQGSISK